MKNIITFTLLLFIINNGYAQSEEEKIKNTIKTVFEAMEKADSSLLKSVLASQCTLSTVAIKPEKSAQFKIEKIEDFVKSIGTKRPNTLLEERLLSFEIKIDEALAVAWTPYEFYINNNLSHRGTNVFTLVKIATQWKIVAIIDTRKRL
jgi:Putative lumazine-binding